MKRWATRLGAIAGILAIITFALDLPEKITKLIPKDDRRAEDISCAQGPCLKGQLLLIGENGHETPEVGADVTLKETGGKGRTKAQGLFQVFLPAVFKAGENVTLLVEKPGWVIYSPWGGEVRVPDRLKKEVTEIRLLPQGSKKFLSEAGIEKLITDAAEASNKQVKTEGKPEKIDFSRFIENWALKYGFRTDEANVAIERWVAEVEKEEGHLFKRGLAAFIRKKFLESGKLFSKFAENQAKALEGLEVEKSLLTEEIVRGYRKAGDAFYNNYSFDEALSAYNRALTYIDEKARPRLWAKVQIEIGNTNRALGIRVKGLESRDHLSRALRAYRNALSLRTRKALPKEWAMTQNNVGNALRDQGIRTRGMPGKGLLSNAVQAYRKALEVYSQDPPAEDWAMTQNNLGNALWNQGIRAKGKTGDPLLSEAVLAYRKALTVYTLSTLPQDWAMTQNNLGAALSDQGIRKISKARAVSLFSEATKAYRGALSVYTQDDFPQHWAMTQNNLGVALSNQGTRRGGQTGASLLIEALKAYRSALEVRTQSDLPQDWAATQNNIGDALSKQGRQTEGKAKAALLSKAVQTYLSVLDIYTQIDFPKQWTVTQHNLAKASVLLEDWPTAAESYANLLLNDPGNMTLYKAAIFVYNEKLFDFQKAFGLSQAWAERHEDIETRIDFTEKHFTTGRFEEYEERVKALFRDPQLIPRYKIPLQAIGIADAFALNKTESAHEKIDLIFETIRKQNKEFAIGWSFEGTKQFIRQERKLASQRDGLLHLFEALEGKNRDEILSRLKAVRADFQRLKGA